MTYTKNYYHILNIGVPGQSLASLKVKGADLRRAYRNALLAAHPDKKSVDATTKTRLYSVDDVKEAYMVLDDSKKRAEYDNWVLRNPHILASSTSAGTDHTGGQHTLSQDFILGLELLDLSDFKEQDNDAAEGEWTRACRCGDDKGFRILEEDLEDAERRGEKEVLVGCGGCSLWVRVGFEVEED